MQPTLDKLKTGIRKFRAEIYPFHADTYRQAVSKPQTPHTLFITCADSRIDAETITHSGTGDLFIMRNIGNLVPAYGEMLGGVSAVIEYAVNALKVKHIVICGHSDCGAMKALLQPDSMDAMPTVKAWMRNAAAAIALTRTVTQPDEEHTPLLARLTEENVLLQLQTLRTHPSVAAAIARKELTLSGWVYEIGTGEIRISEDSSRIFRVIEVEEHTA